MPKVGPGRLPESEKKSIKTDIWASVCPLGVPLQPRITKMVSQDQQRSSEVSKIAGLGRSNTPFAFSSAVKQSSLPASKGAGGRGEAFKYSPPPFRGAGRA